MGSYRRDFQTLDHSFVLECLHDDRKLPCVDSDGDTPLIAALSCGFYSLANTMLDNDYCMDIMELSSPIGALFNAGDNAPPLKLFEKLLDKSGYTPESEPPYLPDLNEWLMIAMLRRHLPEFVRLLYNRGWSNHVAYDEIRMPTRERDGGLW